MKKSKILFFILGALVFSLSACNTSNENSGGSNDPTPGHEHTYSSSWNYDDTYHWHDATCGHDVVSNKERHTFNDVVTPASYSAGGYTTHTCTVCGYSYTDSQTDQLVHHYESGWSHDESTHWHACTDSGYEHLKSGEASHTFNDVVTPASYSAGGYTTHTCTVCGYSYTDSQTDRLSYSITWKNWDNSVLRVDQCYQGSTPSYGSTPTRNNDDEHYYVFTGWSPNIVAAYSDATYIAQYSEHERTSFTISYNSNGGDITPSSQTKTKGRALTLTSTKPTKEGHAFIGWNNIYENVVYSSGSSFNLDRDVTLWALWEDTCEHCNGTGTYSWTSTCSFCSGTGKRDQCNSCGSYSIKTVIINGIGGIKQCNNCSSTSISTKTCTWCNGKGSSSGSESCTYCNHTGHHGGDAPTTSSIEARRIVLNAVSGFEYSKDKINWQSSPIFDNLAPSTSYSFYQRRATSGNTPFGETSKSLSVTTSSTTLFYVTYVLNGGTNNPSNPTHYYSNQSSKTLYNPSRDYYDFAGWTYKGSTVTSIDPSWQCDIELVANWTTHSYSISYDYAGGHAAVSMPSTYTCETSPFVLPYPERNGYTFTGWTGSNGETPEKDVTIPTQEIGNLSYTANWSLNSYSITYVLFDGTNAAKNPSTFTIEDNIELKDAKKDYYTFEGWYLDSSFKNKITNVNGHYGNLTLYAHFIPFSYNATFESGEGRLPFDVTLVWGDKLANETHTYYSGDVFYPYQFNIPTRSGYLFNGWYLDSSFTTPVPDSYLVSKNTTLYAQWFKAVSSAVEMTAAQTYSCTGNSENKYIYFYVSPEHSGNANVEFYLKGSGIGSSGIGITYSQFRIEDASNNNKQVCFEWCKDSSSGMSGTTQVTLEAGHAYHLYVFSQSSSGEATVTITPNDYSLTSVECVAASSETLIENYDGTTQYPNPTRYDYDFDGWYSSNGELIHDVWDYTEDQTFTPHWKLHEFAINYVLDGGTNNQLNPSSYNVEGSTIVLHDPTKEGYTFEGWFVDSSFQHPISEISCESRKDYTLYAKWVADYFTVDYVLYGGTNNPSNISSIGRNQDFVLLNPSREGYTFEGWHLESSFINRVTEIHGSDRHNHKLYAKWVPNSYTATLNYDGGQNCPTVKFVSQGNIIRTVDLYKDSTLDYFIPDAPSANLKFGGWYTNSACTNVFDFNGTVNTDLVLYAKWVSVNSNYDACDLGGSYNVSITGITNQYISIVSPVNQIITVSSSSNLDLYGEIYDSNMNLLYSCDDISDDNLNFSITFTMEAGKVYYISYKANQALVTGDAIINISGEQLPSTHITGDYTEIVESITVVYDSSFNLPTPKKDGYIFVGWFDENGNPIDTSSWSYAESITIYAHWIPAN